MKPGATTRPEASITRAPASGSLAIGRCGRPDADVADGVEAGLRVHHAAALEHDVVARLRERGRRDEEHRHQRGDQESFFLHGSSRSWRPTSPALPSPAPPRRSCRPPRRGPSGLFPGDRRGPLAACRVDLRPEVVDGHAAHQRVPVREDVDGQAVVGRAVTGRHPQPVHGPGSLAAGLQPRVHERLPVGRLQLRPFLELAVLDVVVVEVDVAVLRLAAGRCRRSGTRCRRRPAA